MAEKPRRPRWRRWLERGTVVAVMTYLLVLVMLILFENSLVFPALRAEQGWMEPGELAPQDVSLALPDGTPIHGWWCPHKGASGALLYCHGNGGNISLRSLTYRNLQKEQNVSVLAIDYPGYGRSGGKPDEAGCCAAAEAGFAWLTSVAKVPAERIILFGESLGSGVAVELATRHPCRALVLMCAFTSLPDAAHGLYPFLPCRWLMRNRFENSAKLPGVHRPVFLYHGDADDLISPAHAMRLREVANEPVELYSEQGGTHELEPSPGLHAALRAFLQKHAP